jgi:acetyl esterase/lipase
MIVIIGLLVVVALVVVYLLVIAVIPGMDVPARELPRVAEGYSGISPESVPGFRRVGFEVKGDRVDAWLFLPGGPGPFACIVMGHGLGGTKDMLLADYAARFVKEGWAALAFDYRYFGESEGQPRQLIRVPDQLEDYAGAVEYARSLPEIDSAKVALWGTSFSGGHVMVHASKDHRIAGVVAQCPGLDGREAAEHAFKLMGLGYVLRMAAHGQRDLIRSLLGLSPHRIPIVGPPGSVALMTTPEAQEKFPQMARPGYVNEACARINIRGDKYRPVKHAKDVRCPVLLQICDQDKILPPETYEGAVAALGEKARVKHYPIGHYDIYLGENFETAVADQVEFFRSILEEKS